MMKLYAQLLPYTAFCAGLVLAFLVLIHRVSHEPAGLESKGRARTLGFYSAVAAGGGALQALLMGNYVLLFLSWDTSLAHAELPLVWVAMEAGGIAALAVGLAAF